MGSKGSKGAKKLESRKEENSERNQGKGDTRHEGMTDGKE